MILQNHIIPVNENGGLPLSKRYWAILATALGVGISVIDVTIANVALPTIAHDLGTSPSVTIWIVNAYQMAITISLLSFSSLGDIYGYRKIYLSGVLLFSITSGGLCLCRLVLDADYRPYFTRIRRCRNHWCEYGATPDHLSQTFSWSRNGHQRPCHCRVDRCRTDNRFNYSLIGFMALAFCHQHPSGLLHS